MIISLTAVVFASIRDFYNNLIHASLGNFKSATATKKQYKQKFVGKLFTETPTKIHGYDS
jgi:hypothetical protein